MSPEHDAAVHMCQCDCPPLPRDWVDQLALAPTLIGNLESPVVAMYAGHMLALGRRVREHFSLRDQEAYQRG